MEEINGLMRREYLGVGGEGVDEKGGVGKGEEMRELMRREDGGGESGGRG